MALPIALALLASCKDSKSYSELLDDEEKSINSFLAHQKVLKQIPADTVFQTGADAPYYQIDDNGNVYMQVLKAGDRTNNRAQEGETIYFRFGRISINRWSAGYEVCWHRQRNQPSDKEPQGSILGDCRRCALPLQYQIFQK